MATCDTLEVDLSRVDLDITLEQYPCIDVEVLQPDIVIDIGTVANQGPKGDKGDQGLAGPPGAQGAAGPPGQQGLPGNAATIAVGGTVTGAPGSSATVTNSGSSSAAVFNFSIPAGVQGTTGNTGAQGNPGTPGAAATIAVGTTATGAPGSNATVTNSGSSSAATFNFTIPRGDVGPQGNIGPQGPTGPIGTAATATAGTTTTGAPGTAANVTNAGSSSAAVFNFTIPRGDVGPPGPPGPTGSGTGDMLKSVYDNSGTIGIVDAAESVPWTGVTGKPATFPPSTHAPTHLSAGSDPIAIATSVLAGLCPAVDNTTIQVVASKLSAVSLAWTAITGRPSTFPPDSTAMLKSVYDTNADNIVDHAALADAAPWTGITGKPATFPPDATAELVARKGTANGYPSLDATTKVPIAQLPAPTSGNATTAQLVKGDDTRLSDARTPTAHAATHVTGGTDIIVPASAATAGLLKQLSGNTTDFVDGTNTCQNLVNAIQPTIWAVRQRSFSSIGNPTFEVDQRQCGTSFAVTTTGAAGPVIDRWNTGLAGTLRYSVQQVGNNTLVPGTNYCISRSIWRITMTTAQASLGVSDYLNVWQSVEGPRIRELLSDVHSVSLLVRSSVANLKFSMSLSDAAGTRALAKLCTLGAANTFTLITLPNLPVWTGGTTWSTSPGVLGYYLNITLAAGTNIKVAANDTWQTGAAYAATGIDNFAANAGATFDLSYVGHEPGALSTTPQDCSFGQNLDGDMGCLRYFCKSYDLGTKPATPSVPGYFTTMSLASNPAQQLNMGYRLAKPMAKIPTVTCYAYNGTANSVTDLPGTLRAVSTVVDPSTTVPFGLLTLAAGAAGGGCNVHYTADTGW